MNRRAILKGALGGVVGLTLPPLARSAFSQDSLAVVPVSEGFVMLTGAGGNILVRTTSAGVVLVDSGAAEFTDAVKVAKANEHTTVIHVETDPLVYAPDSHSWWDVPVSQVSALESTRTAYETYAEWKKIQRPLVRPADS